MLNYFLKRINNRKGFTLVELVVVISILGILAAIAVPKFTGSTQKARIAADQANRRTLMGVAAMYIASEGLPSAGLTWKEEEGDDGWEDYLQEWPKHPSGVEAAYEVTIATNGEITIDPEPLKDEEEEPEPTP